VYATGFTVSVTNFTIVRDEVAVEMEVDGAAGAVIKPKELTKELASATGQTVV
jgi:hypothetical protein